jgi:cysteine desulfurase
MMNVAYLDNNATTLMPEAVVAEMARWANHGNPSANYASAKGVRAMMDEFRAFILRGCAARDYDVIFTSGATEANNMIVRGVIERARRRMSGAELHVVASAIEHKSILLALDDLVRAIPELRLTLVGPDAGGHIRAQDFARAVRASTVLAICMHGNNETGAVNDINAIARAVRGRGGTRVFMMADIVQTFGKIPVALRGEIDGASVSFHKLHGPPGVGCAIVRRAAFAGVGALLSGTQEGGARGGTENAIGIGTAFAAARLVFAQMTATTAHELALKGRAIAALSARAPVTTLADYMGARTKLELQIVAVCDRGMMDPARYLPGTLMVSVVKHIGPPACNTLIRDVLERARVIVSVGSACNTSAEGHSHVLRAMNLPSVVMDGAIRVSMCGYTTADEIDRFVDGFLGEAQRQYRTAK